MDLIGDLNVTNVTSPMPEGMGFKDCCFLLVAAFADRPFCTLKHAVICNGFLLHPPRLDSHAILHGLTGSTEVEMSHQFFYRLGCHTAQAFSSGMPYPRLIEHCQNVYINMMGNKFITPLKDVGFLCFPYPSLLKIGISTNSTD